MHTRHWLRSILCLSMIAPCMVSAESRPEHMVYLRTIDPSIEQDIRYASAHNFTGHPLDGYGAAECLLSLDAAKALARVQTALRTQGYGLKVFDCYRPSRAVADMGRFATEPGDPRKAEFYPRVDKQDFWRLGYVARVSNHSKGGTLDLTLTGPEGLPAQTWSPSAAQVDCAAPYEQRWHDGAVDMGTGFDCFDERAHTDSPTINATARDNRQRLSNAMQKEGFSGYSKEWWHFTYTGKDALKSVMDFPITAQVLDTSNQLIVVTTKNWTDVQGTAQRYERHGKTFQKYGASFPVVVGQSGLAWGKGLSVVDQHEGPVKREGDGKAPAGLFKLGTAFGYDSTADTKLPYLPLTLTTECVDDSHSKHYNELVGGSTIAKDWTSSEHMRRDDDLYRKGIFIEHNTPASPDSGSCIFFHIWRAPTSPTLGCTAMDPADIARLFSWLDPRQSPLLVQLPETEYEHLRESWNLPEH
ncbi:D-alanyl-D-alanine dipeptidase [Pseudomonas frederiksbergensis]|uniref:D-alanyl-D-alanine dipeptidase n=1 Tax=Pseudomonas frederiksbergensis TaxID=104087 RepID=A0A1J0ETV5_9PSED|nr:M15 family metallopeptidase [Pseudomonas frederiksbergensis]APC19351.1 D-alanyl-D-alanine dipeptidase [Pseudomonas frederiksbergensis]